MHLLLFLPAAAQPLLQLPRLVRLCSLKPRMLFFRHATLRLAGSGKLSHRQLSALLRGCHDKILGAPFSPPAGQPSRKTLTAEEPCCCASLDCCPEPVPALPDPAAVQGSHVSVLGFGGTENPKCGTVCPDQQVQVLRGRALAFLLPMYPTSSIKHGGFHAINACPRHTPLSSVLLLQFSSMNFASVNQLHLWPNSTGFITALRICSTVYYRHSTLTVCVSAFLGQSCILTEPTKGACQTKDRHYLWQLACCQFSHCLTCQDLLAQPALQNVSRWWSDAGP